MRRTFAAVVASFALLGACASSAKSSTSSTPASISSSVAAPKRIVSMSPTSTEMLFAIGAGSQVVAVDSQSNYPPDAPHTALSAYEPNVEAISTYRPDLVIISYDTKGLKASLQTLGIGVLEQPAAKSLDDAYAQISELGAKTGRVEEAAKVVSSMKGRIAALAGRVPRRTTPLSYYHELDNTLYSVTSKSFVGQIYSIAGLQNIADPADPSGQTGGYPQLSAEFLLEANPDFIFLADTKCCGQTAETLAARAGFASLKAVLSGQVVLLDDDVASRWGPRIVDLLETIVNAVSKVPVS